MAALEGAFAGAVGSGPPPGNGGGGGGGRGGRGHGLGRPPEGVPPARRTHPEPPLPPPGFAPGDPAAPGPPGLLLQRRPRTSYSCRKKHKMEEEPEGCPVAKKRLVGETDPGPSAPSMADWALRGGQPTAQALTCMPGPLEVPCEEMEQVMVEPQGEAARRRLQEIEDRIIDEEEEDQAAAKALSESRGNSLPTLVLSDTLKTGLKQDYDSVLTKKIIESMSRPSMELVLWRPLPEFITERAKPSVSVKNYKAPALAERGLAEPEPLEAPFLSLGEDFPPPAPLPPEMPSALLYGAAEPPAAVEEEMEL
uniref:Coiled-coil domain-containing protein 117 n=1 Tax=Pogona vitticeps TaxID=103695 RepID=A0ABM5F1B1_9SAUR